MGKQTKYAGTQTEKNLEAAFAGESQARNKYTYFASVAKKQGFEQIAALFLKTADNEKEHAKMWFKELAGIGDTAENLAAAAEVMHAVTELDGYRVRPAEVTVLAPDRLSVTIHEGRNRQVRRLCALAGLRVLRLVRVAEGELRLGTLASRRWRELTDKEVAYLKSHL